MAKITWLGEDAPGVAGPSFTTCYGLKFPKGEEVEVNDKKTRAEIQFKTLAILVGGDIGQAPSAEDAETIDGYIDGKLPNSIRTARSISMTRRASG
jgi:hypothetical protein